MATNFEARLTDVQTLASSTGGHPQAWFDLFTAAGITTGSFNERWLAWLAAKTGVAVGATGGLPRQLQEYADDRSATNWDSVTDIPS